MRLPRALHSWSVTPKRAVALQRSLAGSVISRGRVEKLRWVCGADLAFSPDGAECVAGVVLWDASRGAIAEQHVARRPVRFPYLPGLLSFREAPAVLAAIRKLRIEPDLFMFDGQGYAHPRRFGLACHVGVWIDRPSLGCAKSVLVGTFEEPLPQRGSMSPMTHDRERVGMAVRTRDDVKPVFVSVGHRVSLEAACDLVLGCCTRYRLPEPTRLADQLVSRERGFSAAAGLEGAPD